MRKLALCVGLVGVLFATSTLALAQSSETGKSGVYGNSGAAGGAASADFDTLMNLIQQTVDPDNWLAAGGQSTMLQYPAGVFIDPKGHMRRVRSDEVSDSAGLANPQLARHPWLSESKLRIVSLKAIDQALYQSAVNGLRPTAELMHLAGLSRIDFVRVDSVAEDILLAGPSGDPAQGFHLEDLAVVTALISAQTTPLGCSIEPSDDGIRAAQAYLQKPVTIKQLARSPRMVVDKLQAEIGPHNVRVFGMRARSGTAIALLDADEHMKKVGFGTVKLTRPIDTYFDHLDRQADVPAQSMVRWWFAYADQPVRVNTDGDTFQLPEQCVRVLSEQQWMTAAGRAATGGNDPAADAFAKDFSEQIERLRSTQPSYSRLCAVFETALGLQLALDATGQPNFKAWLPNLCALGDAESDTIEEPQTVEGLATSHRLKNGTVLAVVSGGVKIDVRNRSAPSQLVESPFLSESVVPSHRGEFKDSHARFWWQ